MSDRAKARERERAATEATYVDDPHQGHHSHLSGTSVYCSCGEFRGTTCVAIPKDWDAEKQARLRCTRCDEHGVVLIGP